MRPLLFALALSSWLVTAGCGSKGREKCYRRCNEIAGPLACGDPPEAGGTPAQQQAHRDCEAKMKKMFEECEASCDKG